MANSNNDVDINVLIGLYNQKLASVSNQNVLLEAKIQTITHDFLEEKTKLLDNISELQKKYDILDIGMGRGGDILKFFTSRVKSYVGIDPDYHGIYSSSTDGALSRLKTFKRKF